ncbi:MAG: cobaltochelatase subunit CobN [Thermoleophilia bacterium]|nr:cobaltochelatase subunit CobN [Thermoleophilia bacterium]
MKPARMAYVTNVTSDLLPLVTATRELHEQHGDAFEVHLWSTDDLMAAAEFERFCEIALQCDLVMLSLMGGKDSFPQTAALASKLAEAGIALHAQPTATEFDMDLLAASTVNERQYGQISHYINYAGRRNLRNMLLYAANEFGEGDFEVREPEPPAWDGIYHPDLDHLPTLDEYLAGHCRPGRPTVGIIFYQSFWQAESTEAVDALIREIEEQGSNVLPVFLHTVADVDLGTKGPACSIEKYFLKNGLPVVDSLISLLVFSLTMRPSTQKGEVNPEDGFLKLGVPILKMMMTYNSVEEWRDGFQGLSMWEVTSAVAMPEFDGMLITVPVAAQESSERDPLTGAKLVRYDPIPERVSKAVGLAIKWAMLRHIPNAQKRVAIILHNNPPRNDNIGGAFGLDTPVSVWNLLRDMQAAGYTLEELPENGQMIIDSIIERCTNDRRWATIEELAHRAIDKMPAEEYRARFSELPEGVRSGMQKQWGEPPGRVFTHGDQLLVPGILNGNVFIGLQPPRGFMEDPEAIYHSPDLPIPYHYHAYYRWIRDVFKADLIMHIGTHGTLEWLPGKSVGLSDACFPDITITDLPNIYPYIINVPGEGTQAKRRSYCCIIDHLVPVMHNADAYEDMAAVKVLIEDYNQAAREDDTKLPHLKQMIWEKVREAHLDHDLDVAEEAVFGDFGRFLERLHAYIHEVADTQIRDGLHTFGEPPDGARLDEFLVALTRLANSAVPSLRQSLVEMQGYDYDELLANRGRMLADGRSAGQVIEETHQRSLELVGRLHHGDFSAATATKVMSELPGAGAESVSRCLTYIGETLVTKIKATTDELTNTLLAAAGGFVSPGPSGPPTRGMADILPTGRNFYSVDPQAIPTLASWKVGVSLGDALLQRYLEDEGRYPQSIGIVLWATCTMRTRGDDVAEILHLMGLRPIWQKTTGRVTGIEVVPLSELGRPRIDVTVRISGLFRDAFPNLVHLLDRAVETVANLNESPEDNYLAQHVIEEIAEMIANGVHQQQARDEALYRLFGDKPGAYGAGVCDLIDAKNWKDEKDLGEVYAVWGGYAYGRRTYGASVPEAFKRRLSLLDATVKNADSREVDMLDSDDFYSYHGGMIAAVRAFKGEAPRAYAGESSDPDRVKIRSTEEETKYVFRARILNPKWIESMKRHGYKGAGDLSRMVDFVFGWDATAEVMEDWMYESLASRYPLDKQMQEWLKDVNPYALQNMTERLLEAIQRGMWDASDQTRQDLQDVYLEIEGMLEEGSETETMSARKATQ